MVNTTTSNLGQMRRPGSLIFKTRDVVDFMASFVIVGSMITTIVFGSIAVLVFLFAGLSVCAFRYKDVLFQCVKSWPLFLLPAFGVFSMLWAADPSQALRTGLQLMVTYVVFIGLIYTVSVLKITLATSVILSCLLVYVALSDVSVTIFQTGEVIKVGPFGSKNFFSLAAAEGLFFSSMLLATSWRHSRLLAAVALFCITVSILSCIQAKSLGTLIAIAACVILAILLMFLSTYLRKKSARTMALYIASLLSCIFTLAILMQFDHDAFQIFMRGIGKDETLTGRTEIWAIGRHVIGDNFWGGVGYFSFWNTENSDAVHIWTMMKREIGIPFGFHNLYIHTWVELGLFGFLIVTGVMLRGVHGVWKATVNSLSLFECIALAHFLFLFSKTFLETLSFSPFSIHTFAFVFVWSIFVVRPRK